MYEYYVKQIIFSQIFVVDRIAVPGLALYLYICKCNQQISLVKYTIQS
jgi:hypothetical protein